MTEMPVVEKLRLKQQEEAEEWARMTERAKRELTYARIQVSRRKHRLIRYGGITVWHGDTPVATFHFISKPLDGWDAVEWLVKLQRGQCKEEDVPGNGEEETKL